MAVEGAKGCSLQSYCKQSELGLRGPNNSLIFLFGQRNLSPVGLPPPALACAGGTLFWVGNRGGSPPERKRKKRHHR
eukprot:10987407-Alexandrium_andersonii.AAC.1